MSLAVAIEAAGGIVLAADSRATFGDPRGMTAANDTVQKIYKLSPRTALAMVGMAEIGAGSAQVRVFCVPVRLSLRVRDEKHRNAARIWEDPRRNSSRTRIPPRYPSFAKVNSVERAISFQEISDRPTTR
ncbi:MAG: hypothetical protein ACLQVL_29315 [Terriglobia bacterium]